MTLPFSPTELLFAVSEGDVTARSHPDLPYTIFNYAPDVQYRNKWNEITLTCRGLILDDDFNIIARPWKKFFNLGQVNLPIQFDDPVEVMDKADGSLGILYPTPWGSDIATRGSFESEQAIHATDLLRKKYPAIADTQFTDYTYLFEIVYPENRIVLNYDGMDDLILLGAVENKTGYYMSPLVAQAMLGWTGPVVEVYQHKSISDALGHMGREGKEGYVIRSHNFMVKLKEPDYLELHRLVTNLSAKNVWDMLRQGKSVSEIVSDFPDEFHSMVEGYAKPLREKFVERTDEILTGYFAAYSKVPAFASRKEFATEFTKHKDSKYYFLLLDSRPINDALWTELKPKETVIVQED